MHIDFADKSNSVFDTDVEYTAQQFKDTELSLRWNKVDVIMQTVFIPANEMLSHAKGLLTMKKKYRDNMPFDVSFSKTR